MRVIKKVIKQNLCADKKKQNTSGSDDVKYVNSIFLTSAMIENIAIYKSVTIENLMEITWNVSIYHSLKRNDQVAAATTAT